jgi:glycosyltransferase involved in cell wall biosynthesis
MKIPKVSVIIPTYNCGQYIVQAIESVFSQTYTDYEIIVVDDGSTDNTRQVLQNYSGKIKYLYRENQGSAVARNCGIEAAKGELIAFLDVDDFFLHDDKLEQQVHCLQSKPELGGVQTGWQLIDKDNQTISNIKPWHKAPNLNLEEWLLWKPVRLSTLMIYKSWLQQIGGFDTQFRQSQDWDLMLRLSVAGCQIDWLKTIAVCYRKHQESITNNISQQSQCIQAVLDKFFLRDDLPREIIEIESKVRYYTLVWLSWCYYNKANYSQMSKYLYNSLNHTPYSKAETLSNWIESFNQFSDQTSHKFDVYNFSNLSEFNNLLKVMNFIN